jgi:hypothetical protein
MKLDDLQLEIEILKDKVSEMNLELNWLYGHLQENEDRYQDLLKDKQKLIDMLKIFEQTSNLSFLNK